MARPPDSAAFEKLLRKLGPETNADIARIEHFYGRAPHGPLRRLVERRSREHDAAIGAFGVHSASEAWGDAGDKASDKRPFESALRDRRLLSAIFSDAVPIGRDGGGQEYVAHLSDPSEIALFDPGQGALRFLATDLPAFVYLAQLGEESDRLADKLGIEPGDKYKRRNDPAATKLTAKVALLADRVNLMDEIVTSDFAETLATTTGATPSYRPAASTIEALHDRADWLIQLLGMGYDTVSLADVVDTFDEEHADPRRWGSAAARLYWLWSAFFLGQDERLDRLTRELSRDNSAWVSDSLRLVTSLRSVVDVENAPEACRDLVRARRTLSPLWSRRFAPSSLGLPPDRAGLPLAVRCRTEFLARRGYARDDRVYTEEARECIAAIRHGNEVVSLSLLPYLDRPPSGGKPDPRFNVSGAALLPFDVAPGCRDTLLRALGHRAADLSHFAVIPGAVRALGRLGARECVPELLAMMTEFAVVWEHGYAKAGSIDVVKAICDALALLADDRAVDSLVSLATRDSSVSASLPLRQRAIFALASSSWDPPDAGVFLREASAAGAGEVALWLLAARDRAAAVDDGLLPVPAIAFALLCRESGRAPSALAADTAKQMLQTVHADPFVVRLSHRVALDVLDAALSPDDARAVFGRTVRIAIDESVRRRAIELLRKRDATFTPTFCDRPSVDAAVAQDGPAALRTLLDVPYSIYRHNVFAKAAEIGAKDVVLERLPAFAADLATYRFPWAGKSAYGFDTQIYAAIRSLRELGSDAESALETLWTSGTIGRARVLYTLGDLGFDGIKAFEKRIQQVTKLEAEMKTAYSSGRFADAVACCNTILDDHPAIAPTWRNLGNAHLGAGKHEEAHAAYRKATAIEPDNAMGWYWVSQALYQLERWDDVILAARRGLAADPESARCRFNLALALQALDRFDEAEAIYDALARSDLADAHWMIADIHLNRALLALAKKDTARAVEHVAAAIATDSAWLAHALAVPDLVDAIGEKRIRTLGAAKPKPKPKSKRTQRHPR